MYFWRIDKTRMKLPTTGRETCRIQIRARGILGMVRPELKHGCDDEKEQLDDMSVVIPLPFVLKSWGPLILGYKWGKRVRRMYL
jgi:hypothetical protein